MTAAAMRSIEAWAQHPQGKAVAAEPLIAFLPMAKICPSRNSDYWADTKEAGAMRPSPSYVSRQRTDCDSLADAGHLDHRAQAASTGLDGLRAAIDDHVPVLQVQTELALGVSV